MNQLLYYFPGVPRPDTALIAKCGLERIFATADFASCDSRGPGDGRGALCLRGPLPVGFPLHYEPESQTWRECAAGAFHVGFATATPPGPDDLLRPEPVYGHTLKLLDDREWMIPAARLTDAPHTLLPHAIGLDSAGQRIYETLPIHQRLVSFADEAMRGFKSILLGDGEPPDVGDDFFWSLSCEALSANYYMSRWEIGALRLLSRTKMEGIASLLCDFPRYYRMRQAEDDAAKKNGSAVIPTSSNTMPGDAGSLPDTNPLTPISCSFEVK